MWTPASFSFPGGVYYIRPNHPAVPQAFPPPQIQFHAEIIEMPVDTMTSVGAVTSVVRGRMNAGYRWNASACAFTTSFTDNILTVSHDNAVGKQEAFRIVSDEEIENPGFHQTRVNLYHGPNYDVEDTPHAQEGHGTGILR